MRRCAKEAPSAKVTVLTATIAKLTRLVTYKKDKKPSLSACQRGFLHILTFLIAALHQFTHTDGVIELSLADTQTLGCAFQQFVVCQKFQTLL